MTKNFNVISITWMSSFWLHSADNIKVSVFKPPGKIYVSGVIDDDDLLLTEKAIDASIREIFS